MADPTETLLAELQNLDDREDDILDVLLRHGAALEESERRLNMVSLADLRPLRDGLTTLEATIDKLQADVAHAEAASTPPSPSPATAAETSNGNSSPAAAPATNGNDAPTTNGHDAPVAPASAPDAPAVAPAPTPLATMTFEELAARLREHDMQEAQIKEILRERLLALGATPVGPDAAVPVPEIADPSVVPVAPRTFKLGDPPMTGTDIARFQRHLNHRFKAWGIRIRISEDGEYGKGTRHAARQVLRGLGVAPEDWAGGITPQLRVLIRKPRTRTPDQLKRAVADRPWLRRLREQHRNAKLPATNAKVPVTDAKAPVKDKKRRGHPAGSVQAQIRKHGGRYEDIIVREAKRHDLSVSLVCAVMEKETGFRNVFGHDAVRNPIKSPAKGVLGVTEANYKLYLKHRNAKQGCQGVGPMQLTSGGLQDRADKLGGCWKESANIRVGCEFLAGNIKRLGSKRRGVRAYNGSGPAAERYATSVLEKQAVWERRLAGAKEAPAAAPDAGEQPTKRVPRTFKLKKPRMKGRDIKIFQRQLNAHFRKWKIDTHISEDGEYGRTTRHAAHQVMTGLGIAAAEAQHGITPQLRIKIRRPNRRTPAERAQAQKNGDYVKKLRKRTNGRGGRALRMRAYSEAKRMRDVRESGGNNRGSMVMKIIRANHGAGPEPWCGDFMAWCYRRAGSKAVTRSWASVRLVGGVAGVKRTKKPRKGNLVRFSFDHIGMFVCWCDGGGREVPMRGASHIKTIEGNTGRSGAVSDSSGGGDGVYMKVRSRSLVSDFLNVSR